MQKWIIPCNPKHYDVVNAFKNLAVISWKQSTNIQVGDIVYIYVGLPYSAVKFETIALEVNKATTINDTFYVRDGTNFLRHGRYMDLQLLNTFEDDFLPLHLLKSAGVTSVQGPFRVFDDLNQFIIDKTSYLMKSQIDDGLDRSLLLDVGFLLKQAEKKPFIYNTIPQKRSKPVMVQNKIVYPRNREVAKNALVRANHLCEIDSEHLSFLRRGTNEKYTEPHHLIPMAYQDEYKNSLDVEANIISLCSNCHNQIHYGEGFEQMLKQLFAARKEELNQVGIEVEYSELLEMYRLK